MEHVVLECLNTEFIENESSYFGYLEKDGIVVYIYSKVKENEEVDKISKQIVDNIASKCIEEDLEYNPKFMMYIVESLNMDYKNLEVLTIIQTNANTFNAVILGDITLKLFRNDVVEFEAINQGGTKQLDGYIVEEKALESGDVLKLFSKELACLTINIKKTRQIDNATKNNKKWFKILTISFIFLFFIIYIIFNYWTIKRYENKIDNINNDLKIYIKNNEVQNISIELKNLEKVYKNLDKKLFLIIPRKKEVKFIDDKNKIKTLRLDVEVLKDVKDKMDLAKKCVEKYKFPNARELFENISRSHTEILNIDNLKKEAVLNISMLNDLDNIDKKIDEATELFNKFKFKKSKTIFESVETICLKYKISISLKDKIQECDEKINEILEEIEALNLKAEENKEKNVNLTLNSYFEMLKRYDMLDDELNSMKIKEKIKKLEEVKEFDRRHAIELRAEAINLNDNYKCREALEAMLESNLIFKKHGLLEELLINSDHIKKIKKTMRDELEKSQNNNIKKERKVSNNREQIIRSINSCIQKGDSCIKEDNIDDAIIEYQRAIQYCEKINYTGDKVDKLKKKLAYAIKKSKGSKWWQIWK